MTTRFMRRQPALVGTVVTAFLLLLLATHSDHWRDISARGLPTLQWGALQPGCCSNLSSPVTIQIVENGLGAQTQPTDLETTTPMVPYVLGSDVPVGAHTWGYNVLDRLYLRNGTFYIVTSNRESVPPKVEIIHRLRRISTQGDEDDEGSEVRPPFYSRVAES